ncbi:MAG TPA: hypothetical protein VF503_22525 [Sphingobium sp.]|uniref:hypothetical protein n=1 Tax=Sphingobium sp. TaxID=1912891 RepID=UPI002ED1DAC0
MSNSAGFTQSIDHVSQMARSAATALKGSSERIAESSREIGLCAVKQAQYNSTRLFAALHDMASSQDAASASRIYSSFLTESSQVHAEQVREWGQMVRQAYSDIWGPVVGAISPAQPEAGLQAA